MICRSTVPPLLASNSLMAARVAASSGPSVKYKYVIFLPLKEPQSIVPVAGALPPPPELDGAD